jgi:hypothetical protein
VTIASAGRTQQKGNAMLAHIIAFGRFIAEVWTDAMALRARMARGHGLGDS